MEKTVTVNRFGELSEAGQTAIQKKALNVYDHVIKIGSYIVNDDGIRYIIKDLWEKTIESKKEDEEDEIIIMALYDDLRYDYKDKEDRLSELLRGYRTSVWNGTIDELKAEARDFTINGVTEKDTLKSQEQGLMAFDKDMFERLKTDIVIKSDYIQCKMHMAEVLLKNKMYELRQKLEPMLKEVKRLKDIIWTIELYLGIEEDIQHLQSGNAASEEEPIRLLQERLYIDEEVGDPSNQGIDFNSIAKFHDWLLDFNDYLGYFNYELLLPYEKSVRIMRVRRYEKEYYRNDAFANRIANIPNKVTYLLIRNGENIYIIETDMQFGDKLFPAETELWDLREKILKENENVIRRNGREMDDEYRQEIVTETMKEATDIYKRNLIIMQGLVDRTEVFGKLFGKVNLMSGDAINKGQIEFIYDADKTNFVEDGKETFADKLKQSQENIGHGSRVYTTGAGEFLRWYENEHREPSGPSSGVYSLEKKKCGSLTYLFLPDDTVWYRDSWGYWDSKKRTKRESFIPNKRSMVDVDMFDHRDIDWLESMFYDRKLRKNYLDNMVLLQGLVDFKKKEFEEETPFAQMIQSHCNVDYDTAMDAIFWWKTKNKHKRALSKDDVKALRMIKKYLKND